MQDSRHAIANFITSRRLPGIARLLIRKRMRSVLPLYDGDLLFGIGVEIFTDAVNESHQAATKFRGAYGQLIQT